MHDSAAVKNARPIRIDLRCKQIRNGKPCGEALIDLHVNGTAWVRVKCAECEGWTTFRWGVDGVTREAEEPK